ncbi:response regulator transcription factor [Desulforamulus hydrothermalis]|uniref:Stage 0 sporulation protein A homolog n=1 Tax=Desulforamulus hydrothermalis Lam5 = DSM 18033 TaxID=1121428 RepID=K8DXQ6_9FIRM|nr:response regulator transcription factor [Desulforamulus hydrothermalis]CCO07394.1 DNA-binding response regulator in two-component system with YedV [Desulforamulus hydrothermalis Lam5 = DSM 18033]SHH41256.1 DNA-binding response regulator, OmpR family, contains REC and winged-helix (wHTH) domain [Desulforamulus hydrothermalis Lam5 = DSM 18033]
MSYKILIIEDDRNICELLALYFKKEGYTVVLAHDGSTGLNLLHAEKPDVIILDIMLPVINGLEVCRLIRQHYTMPVIMLTAKDTSEDKVAGLDTGADDYVVKPFDPKELCARVRAHLRRQTSRQAAKNTLVVGNLCLDMAKYEVLLNGAPVPLKPKEINLLHFLISHPNIVFSRDTLLEKVWGYDYVGETRTVDVHIKRLREKLENHATGWQIKTVWGIGYCLEVKNV